MTNQTDEERDLAFIASETDPQRRHESALDVINDLRRVTIKRIAEASRASNSPLVEALRAEQEKYDTDMRLISKNDEGAIERALTVHVKFLRRYNLAKREERKPPNLNDGPR